MTEPPLEEGAAVEERPQAPLGSLAVGVLALVPLLVAYEWSLAELGGRPRATFEVILTRPLFFLGDFEGLARRGIWIVIAVLAFTVVRLRGWRLSASLLRTFLEGLAGAVLLGPALLVLGSLLPETLPMVELPGASGQPGVDDTARAVLAFGSASYEELLFRLGGFSLCYLLARHSLSLLGLGLGGARWGADAFAVVASSLLFAAFHLSALIEPFGVGGESFQLALFVYRFLSGVLLALLFRWRGVGVAAWAHGLFNLSIALGAGPGHLG